MHDQIHANLRGHAIAEGIHVAEFPGGVHVHQREGRLGRIERLSREVQHHRAVLADRIEHHRIRRLGDELAHDVDALRLEALEMRQ